MNIGVRREQSVIWNTDRVACNLNLNALCWGAVSNKTYVSGRGCSEGCFMFICCDRCPTVQDIRYPNLLPSKWIHYRVLWVLCLSEFHIVQCYGLSLLNVLMRLT
jgi:hypothetical protein